MHHVLLVALTGKRDRLTAASQQDRTGILSHLQHNIIECMRGVYVFIKHSSFILF